MNMQLAALVAALTLVSPGMAVAKGHQPHQAQGNGSGNVYAQNQQSNEQENERENGQENDDQGNGSRENSGNAHSCTNPAGHQRGWCKNHNQNGGGNGQNGNVLLRGVITRVSGNSVTILQGLSAITFDDSIALQYGRVNGSLYPTRSVTVTGYYDNNGNFRATAIS